MTLKEELEILRGEPIQVFAGDPMDIPCRETSDPERLCQHPVVSVHMITYNHEPYIRQAIEGVMMQQTDFEFELVIGEDCSTDKTREICFEYQKKHPDKIRVLWSEKNLYRNPHPAGGNGKRVSARCRGEFIAFCEGDDYWIDPLKLQKQVDVMRKHPNVGLCYGTSRIIVMPDKHEEDWHGYVPSGGLISGAEFKQLVCFGDSPGNINTRMPYVYTATTMVRRAVLRKAHDVFDIFSWRLCMGDITIWAAVAALSDVWFIPDVISTYRRHIGGACMSNGFRVNRDGMIARIYFSLGQVIPFDYRDLSRLFSEQYRRLVIWHLYQISELYERRRLAHSALGHRAQRVWFGGKRWAVLSLSLLLGVYSGSAIRYVNYLNRKYQSFVNVLGRIGVIS